MFRLLALDVDGTLTDGGIYIDGHGGEMKRFHVRDGMGITRFKASGGEVVILSARYSQATERRAKELGIVILMNNKGNKLEALKSFCRERGFKCHEVAYVGDDINDCECLRWAGMGVAVGDSVAEAREAADWVTCLGGGRGAVREVTDELLRRNIMEADA